MRGRLTGRHGNHAAAIQCPQFGRLSINTRSNNRYAHRATQALIKGRTEDDFCLRIDFFANTGCRFIDLIQRHIIATGDVNEDAARALHRHIIKQRIGNGGFSGFHGTFFAFRFTRTHHCLAHLVHHRAHIGKVEIDQPRLDHQVGNTGHTGMQHFIGHGERLGKSGLCISNAEQVLVRNDNQRIDFLRQLLDAFLRGTHATRPLKIKRLGHHTYR